MDSAYYRALKYLEPTPCIKAAWVNGAFSWIPVYDELYLVSDKVTMNDTYRKSYIRDRHFWDDSYL